MEVVKVMACDFFAEICLLKTALSRTDMLIHIFISFMCINACLLPTYVPVNTDI